MGSKLFGVCCACVCIAERGRDTDSFFVSRVNLTSGSVLVGEGLETPDDGIRVTGLVLL